MIKKKRPDPDFLTGVRSIVAFAPIFEPGNLSETVFYILIKKYSRPSQYQVVPSGHYAIAGTFAQLSFEPGSQAFSIDAYASFGKLEFCRYTTIAH